ncbi:MAG: alpha-hydroxy-acid oxidizing protein, partial [Gluconacetobacter diazotrophicus]|nr:alpha-hydroxy-acid oxidizing protein [Gluconacetobacter diazotrophicus]
MSAATETTPGTTAPGTEAAETTVGSPIAPTHRATPAARRRQPRVLRRVLNLEDFARHTRRSLPRAVYGYVSGGSEDDRSVRENRRAFGDWQFVPHTLRDVSGRSQRVTLFGREYDSPFAI